MFELKKVGIVKRASALLLDAILLIVLTTGFVYLISLICRFDYHQDLYFQASEEWETFTEEYGEDIAGYFGCTFELEGDVRIMKKDGEAYSFVDVMNQFANLNGQVDASKPNADRVAEAYTVYQTFAIKPIEKLYAQNSLLFNLLFMMISLGLLLAYLVLEFILPIIFKDGRTIGKKVFGIGVVRSNCVKVNILSLFARTFVGKYAIETMFPVLLLLLFSFGIMTWLAIVLLGAMTILNVALFFATKNRTPIHDLLAYTVVVDINLQQIFQTEEELIAAKTLQHKEKV